MKRKFSIVWVGLAALASCDGGDLGGPRIELATRMAPLQSKQVTVPERPESVKQERRITDPACMSPLWRPAEPLFGAAVSLDGRAGNGCVLAEKTSAPTGGACAPRSVLRSYLDELGAPDVLTCSPGEDQNAYYWYARGMERMGYNAVRFQFLPVPALPAGADASQWYMFERDKSGNETWLPNSAAQAAQYVNNWVVPAVRQLEKAGMHVVLDYHAEPSHPPVHGFHGSYQYADPSGLCSKGAGYQQCAFDEMVAVVWSSVAAAFASDDKVDYFDLFNEYGGHKAPCDATCQANDQEAARTSFKKWTAAVRAHDRKKAVMLDDADSGQVYGAIEQTWGARASEVALLGIQEPVIFSHHAWNSTWPNPANALSTLATWEQQVCHTIVPSELEGPVGGGTLANLDTMLMELASAPEKPAAMFTFVLPASDFDDNLCFPPYHLPGLINTTAMLESVARAYRGDAWCSTLPLQDVEAGACPPSLGSNQCGPSQELVGGTWFTPNGSCWQSADGHTRITGFGTYNHPIIALAEDVAVGATDYTIKARVRAHGPMKEFGLVFGASAGGTDGYLFSSQFGGTNAPWIGSFPATFNPVRLVGGGGYSLSVPGDQPWDLELVVHVSGKKATGTLSMVYPRKELLGTSVEYDAPRPFAGSHIGLYTYGIEPVALTHLELDR